MVKMSFFFARKKAYAPKAVKQLGQENNKIFMSDREMAVAYLWSSIVFAKRGYACGRMEKSKVTFCKWVH